MPLVQKARSLGLLLVVVITWQFSGGSAPGALLELVKGSPDVYTNRPVITYDKDFVSATIGEFKAVGTSNKILGLGPMIILGTSNWTLTAHIDNQTNMLASTDPGSLTFVGDMPGLPTEVRTLLTGRLIAFGYQDSTTLNPELFDFLFDVTGGDLAGQFGPRIGVNLNAGVSNFTGSFNQDFSNTMNAQADTFPVVPEPCSISLWGLSGLVWLAFRRRLTCFRS